MQETIKEQITHAPGDDTAWFCVCGNKPAIEGFFACDKDGNEIEPSIDSDWENLYVCFGCGRIINSDTLEVVGRNPNPKPLD